MKKCFIVFLMACSVSISGGAGLEAAFVRAEESARRLIVEDPASWCVLTNAVELLELRQLYSTNVVSLSGTNLIVRHSSIPGTLSSRIVQFATNPRGFRPGPRRPPVLEKRSPSKFTMAPPVSSTLVSDEELEENARRNAYKRKILLLFLRDHAGQLKPDEQEDWLRAVIQLWIFPPYYPDGGAMRAMIRREEDGIPSDEALLRWFADNENFCDEVRTAASNRLERIVPRMPDVAIPPPGNLTNGVSDVVEPPEKSRGNAP